MVRLKIIGTQWKIVEKLKSFQLISNHDWKITYSSPTYGGWDLIIECVFSNLEELDEIVSFCRTDNDLKEWIEATTTLISTKKSFNLES
ncbi:MAG: hypothetical protein ACFE96_14890 [Candidatus Hermodarchaeota archaeon]